MFVANIFQTLRATGVLTSSMGRSACVCFGALALVPLQGAAAAAAAAAVAGAAAECCC